MKVLAGIMAAENPPLGGCACTCGSLLAPRSRTRAFSPPTTIHVIIFLFAVKGCTWMQLAPVKAANLFRPAPQTDTCMRGLHTLAYSTLAPISIAAAYMLLSCLAVPLVHLLTGSCRQTRLGLER